MVDDLRDNPQRFPGEIRVLGVVGGTKASEHLFGLIDKREVEDCGAVTCPEFLLPVLWRDAMPRVGDEVTVTGRLDRHNGGLSLAASRVETP